MCFTVYVFINIYYINEVFYFVANLEQQLADSKREADRFKVGILILICIVNCYVTYKI